MGMEYGGWGRGMGLGGEVGVWAGGGEKGMGVWVGGAGWWGIVERGCGGWAGGKGGGGATIAGELHSNTLLITKTSLPFPYCCASGRGCLASAL